MTSGRRKWKTHFRYYFSSFSQRNVSSFMILYYKVMWSRWWCLVSTILNLGFRINKACDYSYSLTLSLIHEYAYIVALVSVIIFDDLRDTHISLTKTTPKNPWSRWQHSVTNKTVYLPVRKESIIGNMVQIRYATFSVKMGWDDMAITPHCSPLRGALGVSVF